LLSIAADALARKAQNSHATELLPVNPRSSLLIRGKNPLALTSPQPALENDGLMSDSYSSKLSSLTLPDVDGKPVHLGSLWAANPVVVVFLRHWG
jgi:hypothetical protein